MSYVRALVAGQTRAERILRAGLLALVLGMGGAIVHQSLELAGNAAVLVQHGK